MIKNLIFKSKCLTLCTILMSSTISFAEELILPQIGDFGVSQYGDRIIGEANLLSPFYQNDYGLFLFDGKYKQDNQNNEEINLGLAYRTFVNDELIFGWYNYYDRKNSRYSLSVNQWTTGVELLSEYCEIRANAYLPENKKKIVGAPSVSLATEGTKVFGIQDNSNQEYTLPGYDVEIGFPVFGFSYYLQEKLGTKLLVSKYRFHRKDVATNDGVQLKLEQKLIENLFDNPYSYVMLSGGASKTQGEKWEGIVGLNIRVALHKAKDNSKFRAKYRETTALQRRMLNPVYRDIDVVTTFPKNPKLEIVPIYYKGKEVKNIYFVGISDDESYKGEGTHDKPYSFDEMKRKKSLGQINEANGDLIIPVMIKNINIKLAKYNQLLEECSCKVTDQLEEVLVDAGSKKVKISDIFPKVKLVKDDIDRKILDAKLAEDQTNDIIENNDDKFKYNDNVYVLMGSPVDYKKNKITSVSDAKELIEDDRSFNKQGDLHTLIGSPVVRNYWESCLQTKIPELVEQDAKLLDNQDDVHILIGSPVFQNNK